MPDIVTSANVKTLMESADFAAFRTSLSLTALATTTPGAGVATALALNVGSAGAPVLFDGAGGTPSSLVGTNITGTAAGLTAGTASAVAVGGITGLGTNVATALAINVGTAGAVMRLDGAGGTPSTISLTNGTGLPLTTGVTGNLPVTNLNSGTSASNTTFWRGDGTWATPAGGSTPGVHMEFDGAGVPLAPGASTWKEVKTGFTITRATLLAMQSGSVVIDLYKCTYAQWDAGVTHPVAGDKITASAPPTISSATKSQDSTLTGWTTTVDAGDILYGIVISATTITHVSLDLA